MTKTYICDVILNVEIPFHKGIFSYKYISEDDDLVLLGRRVSVYLKNRKAEGIICKVEEIVDLAKLEKEKGFRYSSINELLDNEPILSRETTNLVLFLSDFYHDNAYSFLRYVLPPKLRLDTKYKSEGKKLTYYYLLEKINSDLFENYDDKIKDLINILNEEGYIRKSSITSKKVLNLIKDYIKEIVLYNRNLQIGYYPYTLTTLSEEQEKVFKDYLESDKKINLLYGKTGSGKTEIYIHLAKYNLDRGKSTLIIIPEISLSDEISKKFNSVFKDNLYVIHSLISQGDRYEFFKQMSEKECCVVLGTKTAAFAPANNLADIVIDEEHYLLAYKEATRPFFDTFTVCRVRGLIEGTKLLLGSGSPLITSMYRAQKGLYKLLKLTKKYNEDNVFHYKIVNMSKRDMTQEASFIFSNETLQDIEKTLESRKQIIIYSDSLAYSQYLICDKCHQILQCPHCESNLIFYSNDKLRCSKCSRKYQLEEVECQNCQGDSFIPVGFGNERIKEELNKIFPNASVVLVSSKLGLKERLEIFDAFKNGQYDFLVGSSIVTKGHNFPKAELGIIPNVDSCLIDVSYLTNENAFATITQFCGRFARFNNYGRVIVQTNKSKHPVLHYALKDDYDSLYEYEIKNRKAANTPPFILYSLVRLSSKNEEKLKDVAKKIRRLLSMQKELEVRGPYRPYIGKINDIYFVHFDIKYKSKKNFDELVEKIVKEQKSYNINIEIDYSPLEV